MQILFLSRWYPDPPDNGSKLRVHHLLKGLSREHHVDLISYHQPHSQVSQERLLALCDTVQTVPYRSFNPQSVSSLRGLLSRTPRFLVDTYQSQLESMISQHIIQTQPDVIVASQWETAYYSPIFKGLPAIFEELELGTFVNRVNGAANPLQRLRHQLTYFKLKHYTPRLLSHFDAVTTVSKKELSLLERVVGPEFHGIHELIPNAVDLERYTGWENTDRTHTLIFTGSVTYQPNYQAVVWFLEEVFPIVRKHFPAVKFAVTGDRGDQELPNPDGFQMTGYVEDIRPLLASSAVSVVPLLSGGGTRFKILEALAMGIPVVSTRKGAEGLDLNPDNELMIADEPQSFAESVIRLLSDPRLMKRMGDAGRAAIEERYNWSAVMPQFMTLVQRVAKGNSPRLVESSPSTTRQSQQRIRDQRNGISKTH